MSAAITSAATPAASSAGGSLGRLLWSYRREALWVALFSFFANLLMLTPTLYMLQVYDRVLLSGSELTLLALTVTMVVFFLVMGFAEWVRSRLQVRVSAKLDAALSRRVFNASFERRLTSSSAGGSPLQALNDLTVVRQYLTGNGAYAFFDLPWSLIYLAVLFVMHVWLGWAAVVFSVLLAAIAVSGHRLTSRLQEQAMARANETNVFLHGKLRNGETIEAMGMLGDLRRMWQQSNGRFMQAQEQATDRAHHVQALSKFVQYTVQSLTLALGALLVLKGEMGVGAMIASNALISNAIRPISTLVATWRQTVEARRSFLRLDEVLGEHHERESVSPPSEVKGQVTLRNLTASAEGRSQPILNGLNADFQAGEVVAIVGPSGAGKSTLARCLVGIWPGVREQVFIDGCPVEQWSREDLGPRIGYLPQDIELLDGTIAENIARMGDVDAGKVVDAAVRTGLHEMILRLPKGYDTPIGEAGGLLSGGQRQRIGLARALYGDPAIVVLDEPNASLDDVGEAALVQAIRTLKSQGTTVFMIVHQAHILTVADRALLLDQGRIVKLAPIAAQPRAPKIEAQA